MSAYKGSQIREQLPREDSADLATSITRMRYQVTDVALEIKGKEP